MPTSDSILRTLGLIGSSGVHTGSLVPRAQTPDAEQRLFTDFLDAGKVADPDVWTKFNSYMKRPTTFESMLQLWEEMSMWDLLAAALVEIVDEATQTDANSPGTLWYKCNDEEFEEDLNDMLDTVGMEDIIQSQVYYVAALGNHFEKLEYAPEEGVIGMSFVHPYDVRRYWLERNRRCIGFRWTGNKPNKDDVFVMPDNRTPVERVQLNSGRNVEDLWYPWDFLHFRRMFRMRISEHGEPIFAEADGIYKKLRLAVDQMVVHRAQVQPDRYAINIDVQEQPPIEQMKTVHRWRQQLRSKIAFGNTGSADSLSAPTDFASFYNAWALDTVLYLAQPKGFNNTIDKLQGTTEIPDVYDIELLTDLFYSIIGMPRNWFTGGSGGGGGSDGAGEAPSGRALLAQDMRFLRKIKSIRRPIVQAYEWLAYFHAVLKGKDPEMLEIKAEMSPIGSLEDQLKMEMLEQQANVLTLLGDVMEKYNLPKEAWIETIFKRYMHLPDDVVNVFLTALPAEAGMDEPQMEGRRVAPSTRKLIQEIEAKVGADRRVIRELERVVYEKAPKRKRKVYTKEDILNPTKLRKDGKPEFIVSSFGRHPLELKRTEGKTITTAKALMESADAPKEDQPKEPAYRKWVSI